MKRSANLLIWATLLFAIVAIFLVTGGHWSTGTPLALAPTPTDAPVAAIAETQQRIAVGSTVRVELDVHDPLIAEFTALEQREQKLDWLLWFVANDAAQDDDDLNRALFDTPLVRHGFSRTMTRLEYGITRSSSLNNGDVIALIPHVDGDHRRDDLAVIADEQRKNQGKIPGSFRVFEYRFDDDGAASITRTADVTGADLFTGAYGYVEAPVTTADELESFMRKTDDLVYVHLEGDALHLGGRKLATGYQNIRPVDAATVWQANVDMTKKAAVAETRLAEFDRVWQQKEDKFNANPVYRQRLGDGEEVFAKLKREHDAEYRALMEEIGFAGGIGFSLDPKYDYEQLRAVLAEPTVTAMLKKARAPRAYIESLGKVDVPLSTLLFVFGVSEEQYGKVIAALAPPAPDIVPLLKLIDELKSDDPSMDAQDLGMRHELAQILDLIQENANFQAARYDGALGGTEVGMVLFYTDLTAKLWALDYQRSTPTRAVADFRPLTETRVSPSYNAEMKALPSTRLWFGPNEMGYQAGSDDELMFARTSTRIYAASSSPLEPGKEVPPNAESEAFLGWWNDHYDAVAKHEPLYQRLNEIMKWSLITGWLEHLGKIDSLQYLESMPVDRSAWFPSWARANKQLKYDSWNEVAFYGRGNRGSETESMPILYSEPHEGSDGNMGWVLSGGVSLGSKEAFKSISRLPDTLAPSLRRAGFSYQTSSGMDELVALRGARYQFEPRLNLAEGVGTTPVRLRMIAPEGAKLRSRFGDVNTGDFARNIVRTPEAMTARLEANGAEVGALSMRSTRNGFRVSWHAREVDDGIMLARGMSVSKNPAVTVGANPNVSRAVKVPGQEEYYVQFHGSNRWMQMAAEGGPQRDLAPGWAGRAAEVRADARTYQYRWHDENALPADIAEKGQWLRGQPPRGPGSGATLGEASAGASHAPRDPLLVADDIARDPGAWKRARDQQYKADIAYVDELARQRPEMLPYVIADLKGAHQGRPELLLREALADLGDGNLASATKTLEEMNLPASNPTRQLLEEFNARLGPLSKDMESSIATLEDAMLIRAGQKAGSPHDVALAMENDRLVLQANLTKPPMQAVNTAESIPAGSRVFVEDTASLNNIDWITGRQNALDHVIDDKIGTVFALPRGDLASYRPQRIAVDGKVFRSTEPVANDVLSNAGGSVARTINAAGSPCVPDPDDPSDCQSVIYLVSADVPDNSVTARIEQ